METPNISERMREVREENQLTQHAMALKLGINQMQLDATIVCLDPEDTGRIDYEDFINGDYELIK